MTKITNEIEYDRLCQELNNAYNSYENYVNDYGTNTDYDGFNLVQETHDALQQYIADWNLTQEIHILYDQIEVLYNQSSY